MASPAAVISHRRRSWIIALLSLLVAGGIIGGLGEAETSPEPTDGLAVGADSTRAVELGERFPAGDDSTAVVLFTVADGTLSPAQLSAVTASFTDQLTQPGSAPSGGPPVLIPSEDGTAAIGVLPIQAEGNAANAQAVEDLRTTLRNEAPDGVSVQVTGPAAIRADLGAVFDGANVRLLLATASVVAVLLLITYRSPILWLVPLIVVGIADRLAAVLATHVLEATGVAWDESTVGILSVLVFGAGTDYALLLISRYRDELRTTPDRFAAMRTALGRTAEAVLASATTVVLGVLTLLLSAIPATRGLGLASAVGIVVAAGYALVVLPSVLVLFGRWVFWPLIPRVGQAQLVESRSIWRWVGDRVARRPMAFVAGTVAVLVAMAAGITQISMGLSDADQFLKKPEAIAASERLAESFPAGSSDPAVVITAADPQQVVAAISAVDGVSSATLVGSADELSKIAVVLAGDPGSDQVADTVLAVRSALADYPETFVGGSEAQRVDLAAATSRDRMVIIPIILGLVLVALFLLLRSVVAPLILVITVVATYLAALGASWWLFTGVFGFKALDDGAPLLAFLFLVALGVDYNIFLVTRAREEAAGHGTRSGMLRALTVTGGVITSAGILLAAVFAVLGVLPLVVLAQLGVIICVGVLLDTLVVRTVLVPAIALLLGDQFWWPRTVSRDREDSLPVGVG
jgi:RND superfamily putative drug exporter